MPNFERLKAHGAEEVRSTREIGAYVAKFVRGGVTTTIKFGLEDSTGADMVVLNMTTKPDNKVGLGYGSLALTRLIGWAQEQGYTNIRACQVQDRLDPRLGAFWARNNFTKLPPPNPTSDYIRKL